MTLKARLVAFGGFLVVLLGLAAWSHAQLAVAPRPIVPPVVLAGPDIGFRMTGAKGDVPVGQLVVRIKGEWKVVEFGASSLPLGK
ncbi:MAG TPA: hypothetical protein VFO31_13230 [Vicinamibacterales bacterium]|nr:hypothetical protein [Vicinamibacterales bacterium]